MTMNRLTRALAASNSLNCYCAVPTERVRVRVSAVIRAMESSEKLQELTVSQKRG